MVSKKKRQESEIVEHRVGGYNWVEVMRRKKK